MLETALKGSRRYWGWIFFLLTVIGIGFIACLYQFRIGLGVTGMSRDVSWGLYIGQFTFLVGVAASGVIVVLPYYLHNYKAFGRITGIREADLPPNRAGAFVKSCFVDQVRDRVCSGYVEADQSRREGLDLPNLVLRGLHLMRYGMRVNCSCHIDYSGQSNNYYAAIYNFIKSYPFECLLSMSFQKTHTSMKRIPNEVSRLLESLHPDNVLKMKSYIAHV